VQHQPVSETADNFGAFPRLSEEQLAALSRRGERRPTRAGEVLFRAGDEHYDFHVVLAGRVAVVEDYGGQERVIAVHGPGRFLGELGLLAGQAAFFTAVVREPGEVLGVPVPALRELVAQDPALGDLVLRAYLLRREMLIGLGAGFRIIGSRYSPDCRRLREFAARNRLPHRWIDLEEDEDAEALLRELGVGPEETPVVIWGNSEVLRNPSASELARRIGLRSGETARGACDLLVVGAGPAGLAAAVYGASEGLSTIALDAVATGGQAGTSSRIENYLGFPSGISGGELAERAVIQAEKFGAGINVPAEAAALGARDGHYVVRLADGGTVAARTVILATGAQYRRLRVPGIEAFEGTSVYYAATHMEARMCVSDPVAVVGGGNSAGQAAMFLSRSAAEVRLLILHDDLRRDMSRYLVDQVELTANVHVMPATRVCSLTGGRVLEAIEVEDCHSGERRTLLARALFVFIGADPHTSWLGCEVALDRDGYVRTGPAAADASGHGAGEGRRDPPLSLETSRPGIFAVGDLRSGAIKRVASAVGEGSMAVRLVYEHFLREESR
jgi:thioredoxin reductase (NADPH)